MEIFGAFEHAAKITTTLSWGNLLQIHVAQLKRQAWGSSFTRQTAVDTPKGAPAGTEHEVETGPHGLAESALWKRESPVLSESSVSPSIKGDKYHEQ